MGDPLRLYGLKALVTGAANGIGEAVARTLGIIESSELTPDALEQLILRVLEFDHVDELLLSGLADRRAQVWPGGLATGHQRRSQP